MRKSVLYFIVFYFIATTSFGQNLTGTWEGSVRGRPYFRLEIIQTGDTCVGYRHDQLIKGLEHINMQAYYNSADNTLTGNGNDLADGGFNDDGSFFSFQYITEDKKEFLKGYIAPDYIDKGLLTISGAPIQLEKISNKITIKKTKPAVEAKKKDSEIVVTPKLPDDSAIVIKEKRTSTIIKTIMVKTDTVKIILKDDGEVDGDIVTIFDNGKIIISNLLLTSDPYEITLNLPSGSTHLLELMAVNQGRVPPNTAYMLVLSGESRVEVKASSDVLSNAAIVIRRE